jgi:hypothetical protein
MAGAATPAASAAAALMMRRRDGAGPMWRELVMRSLPVALILSGRLGIYERCRNLGRQLHTVAARAIGCTAKKKAPRSGAK